MAATFVTVTFNRVWLTDPYNPTVDAIQAGSAGSLGGGGQRNRSGNQQGEVRQYANGRTRLVLGESFGRTMTLVVRALTRDQIVQLSTPVSQGGHCGRILLARDSYGTRMFGAYLAWEVLDIPLLSPQISDFAFEFSEVTYPEIV